MSSQDNNNSYTNIFKTTFVFGFVQIIRTLISIINNKLVDLLIGAEGMGIIGIFNSAIMMIQTGAGLGINQSAVRDIAKAKGERNDLKIANIINITNKIILFAGLIGLCFTLISSKYLSNKTFGSNDYTISYCFIGVVVAVNIINEGKLAILKGLREIQSLAKASVIGAIVGLLTAVPLYYNYGLDGIIPELLIASILALFVSNFYINKLSIDRPKIKITNIFIQAKPIILIGMSLMFVTFLQNIVSLILNSYIRSCGGIEHVGYYSAGVMIINGYFGVISTALLTDYYPRIASVHDDNKKIQNELNKQSIVSAILSCPMFVFFMVFAQIIISLLYTKSFTPTFEFVRFAIYWSLITICSNQIDMILVAKANIKVFTSIALFNKTFQLLLCIILYSKWQMLGLGISYAIMGCWHMFIMSFFVYRFYKIRLSCEYLRIAFVLFVFAFLATTVSYIESLSYRLLLGIALFFISLGYSLYMAITVLKTNFLINIFKRK